VAVEHAPDAPLDELPEYADIALQFDAHGNLLN
jgi:hypothetical protein